jgi:hypothetical protein
MPLQRTISLAPIPPLTRATPRRNALTITNYARPERIDEPIQNPPQTPRAPTRNMQADSHEGTEMADGDDNDEDDEEEQAQLDDEMAEILDPDTPTQRNLSSTVVTKRHRIKKRTRKARSEMMTWTQHYFDVTPLEVCVCVRVCI